jgi:hypothetical protein
MREPAEIVEDIERHPKLPPGSEERFFGYGVMGLPFRSGHVLGLRRFPASSIGPGYRSIWHRDPDGRWTFYQDQPAELACTRYFGAEVDEVRQGPIRIDWTGPRGFEVRAGDGELEWMVEVGSTPDLAPNGQRFVANPRAVWVATASRATVAGADLGEMGPAPEQAQLRDSSGALSSARWPASGSTARARAAPPRVRGRAGCAPAFRA